MATKKKEQQQPEEAPVTLDLGELPGVSIPDEKGTKFISPEIADIKDKKIIIGVNDNFFELCSCIRSLDNGNLSILSQWDIAVAYDIFLRQILYNDNMNAITSPTAVDSIIGIDTKLNEIAHDTASGSFCAMYSYIVDIINRSFRNISHNKELFGKNSADTIRAYSLIIIKEFVTFTNELLDTFRACVERFPGISVSIYIDPMKVAAPSVVTPRNYFKSIDHNNHYIWFSSHFVGNIINSGEENKCIGIESFLIYPTRPSYPVVRSDTFNSSMRNTVFSTQD